jgi:hypothetical protein
MKKRFAGVKKIETLELFEAVSSYGEELLREATLNGSLDKQGADNEYTRELGRTIRLCAAYEEDYMVFDNIDFNAPLGYYDSEDPDVSVELCTSNKSIAL